jgi:archaellum component FlaC
MEMKFTAIDERFAKMDLDFREIKKDIIFIRTELSNLDKQIAVITATLRFNGFDLDRHKAAGE